jgi:drug/metabolite transporter (DMT)-like permease
MPRALSLMVAAACCWAVATVLTKVALHELTAADLLGVELGSSALISGALVLARRARIRLRSVGVFIALGALEPALSFALFDLGLARTGAADGAILIASDSVFGVLFARALLGERFTARVATAVLVGFLGSTLVGLGQAGQQATLVGDLLILAASATTALYGVASRRYARAGENLAATAVQLTAAAVLALPVTIGAAIAGSSRLGSADPLHVAAALAVGLLGGVLPFLAFNAAIRHVTIASAGLVSNLVPVIAIVLAVGLLGEQLTWQEALGGLLVVGAAAGA